MTAPTYALAVARRRSAGAYRLTGPDDLAPTTRWDHVAAAPPPPPRRGRRPMAEWAVADVLRIADAEHGSLLDALDVDYDLTDPDDPTPIGLPRRMEALA